MYEIQQSDTYRRWRIGLRDRVALLRINARLRRMEFGYFGDTKHVGEGVREIRIDHGPGYRVYYIQRNGDLIVLLAGGHKGTQDADIRRAIRLAEAWDKKR